MEIPAAILTWLHIYYTDPFRITEHSRIQGSEGEPTASVNSSVRASVCVWAWRVWCPYVHKQHWPSQTPPKHAFLRRASIIKTLDRIEMCSCLYLYYNRHPSKPSGLYWPAATGLQFGCVTGGTCFTKRNMLEVVKEKHIWMVEKAYL